MMAAPFETTRRVQFRDTDAAGIMHFSVFFTYMEEVEHELLRSLGLSVVMPDQQGTISWPRVAAQCDFHSAVHFEDLLRVTACVKRLGEKSVTYAFDFTSHERHVASGSITSVCCLMEGGKPLRSIAIPQSIANQLANVTLANPE